MPEGHTLRRLADALDRSFAGERLRVTSPQGRFAESAALLDGCRLVTATSSGKHLFLEFDEGRQVHVHLGLYGSFRIARTPEPEPVGQVRMRLVGETSYADLRGATACEIVEQSQADHIRSRLGPDPLDPDADPGPAWERLRRSRVAVGALLMDQSVMAGVGNVYRAEVLFRSRLHPLRPARTLQVSRFEALWADLVVLMADGVRLGRIETLRPEDAPAAAAAREDEGRRVRNYVYRRTGRPCLVCGSAVRTQELVQRNVFWCSRCQPVFRSRAVG